jgi:hypothetical protein
MVGKCRQKFVPKINSGTAFAHPTRLTAAHQPYMTVIVAVAVVVTTIKEAHVPRKIKLAHRIGCVGLEMV